MLAPGTKLGPYSITTLLGAGGMGEVYRATDERLGREVAIKVLPEHLESDAPALERFRREARAVASLSHSNIVALFDVGESDGIQYAVTELLDGETLRSRLARGRIPVPAALAILAEIADGVAAAHERGIVHRDLKPENIFITSAGGVKVLDFGLARGGPAVPSHQTSTDVLATEPGVVLGTIGYMAPEQAEGKTLTPATDVFALGCILFEMIAGRVPFEGISSVHALAALLRDPAPRLRTTGGTLEANVDGLVQQCLEKDPKKRPADAGALAEEVRTLLSDAPIVSTSKRVLRASRSLRWRIAAGLAMVALIAIIATLVVMERHRRIDDGYDLHLSDLRADSDTRRLIELALRADAEGDRARSVELFEEAHRRAPSAIPAAFLSSFAGAAGDEKSGQRWGVEAEKRIAGAKVSSYESLLVRFLTAHDESQQRSLALSKSILAIRPHAWRLRLAAAHVHLARRERGAALRELQGIDVRKPDDRKLILVLADRGSLGDVDAAERDLRRSRLAERPALLRYVEARLAWSRGNVREAAQLYDLAADAAAAENLVVIEIDARELGALARLRLRDWPGASRRFVEAVARAKQVGFAYREFECSAFAAYAAHHAGDFDERDRKLEEAHAVALHPGYAAGVRLLAIRMRSTRWQMWTMPDLRGLSDMAGVESLIRAREAWSAGNVDAARAELRRSRAEGVDTTGMREEAELLSAELGLPAQLLPPDPPYPNLLRYLAIFDLAARAN